MDLTEPRLKLLHEAWAINARGMGLVVQPEELPDAHALAEAGWLERRVDDVCMSWWWTPQAEAALTTGALITDSQGRRN